jgi:hypothetical protein
MSDLASVVTRFERSHPDLFYHIAKGRPTVSGEPIYAAIICRGEADVSAGGSNTSPVEALLDAIKNGGFRIEEEGTFHMGVDMAKGMTFVQPCQIVCGDVTYRPVEAVVKRIADVAAAMGALAGEPATEIAGQAVSVLAVNPEHCERFMAEGSELFVDRTFNAENGSLSYRAMNGSIMTPAELRAKRGMQQ